MITKNQQSFQVWLLNELFFSLTKKHRQIVSCVLFWYALSYFLRNVRTLFLFERLNTTSLISATNKVVFRKSKKSQRNGLTRYENDSTVVDLSLEQMAKCGYSKFIAQSVRKTEISWPLVIWKRKTFLSVFFYYYFFSSF